MEEATPIVRHQWVYEWMTLPVFISWCARKAAIYGENLNEGVATMWFLNAVQRGSMSRPGPPVEVAVAVAKIAEEFTTSEANASRLIAEGGIWHLHNENNSNSNENSSNENNSSNGS